MDRGNRQNRDGKRKHAGYYPERKMRSTAIYSMVYSNKWQSERPAKSFERSRSEALNAEHSNKHDCVATCWIEPVRPLEGGGLAVFGAGQRLGQFPATRVTLELVLGAGLARYLSTARAFHGAHGSTPLSCCFPKKLTKALAVWIPNGAEVISASLANRRIRIRNSGERILSARNCA